MMFFLSLYGLWVVEGLEASLPQVYIDPNVIEVLTYLN